MPPTPTGGGYLTYMSMIMDTGHRPLITMLILVVDQLIYIQVRHLILSHIET